MGLHEDESVRHGGGRRVPRPGRLQPEPLGHRVQQLGTARRRGLHAQRSDGAARRLRHHLSAEQHRLLLGPERLRLCELLGRRVADSLRHESPRRGRRHVLGSVAHRGRGRRRRDRAAGLRDRRVAVHPPVQERPLDAVERLHRAVGGDELDGRGRLHRVALPPPAEPVVPHPEPAEHRSGGARSMACDVHRQQRHGEPGDAAGAEPLSALERTAAAVRRRAGRGDDHPPDDVLPVSDAGPRHRQQLGRERRLSRHAVAGGAALRARHDARRDLYVVEEHRGHQHRHRGRPGLQRRRHRHELGHQQPREQPDDRPERRAASVRGDVPLSTCRCRSRGRRRRRSGSSRRSPATGRSAAR